MADAAEPRRISTRRRQGKQVSPLELFFDLVFVLAITQTSALMGNGDGATAVVKGLLVLGVLWWAWVGYSWLTSVVDPDDGVARLVVFVAMAGMLVVALCVPQVFDDRGVGLLFAVAYGVVRSAQIALFVVASGDDPGLRRSVIGLGASTAIGVALLVGAAFADGVAQGAIWALALAIDMGGPFVFGADGWMLEPTHFAERHGLIVLIALGESIVALGVGSEVGLTTPVVSVAVLGVVLAAAMWWSYFDVGSKLAARRLEEMSAGREQNEVARDGYSYLHFPMVAGVVLVALALEHALSHITEPLDRVSAIALCGGLVAFLGGQIGFKLRFSRTLSRARTVALVAVALLTPVALVADAWVAVLACAVVMWALIAFEVTHYGDLREETRAWEHRDDGPAPG
jgi:low temperature requirement protein LtrA